MSDTSALLFLASIFAIALMIISYITKQRIFNLLCVAPLLYLAIELSASVPLLIGFIGLIIFQLYYTFFQWRE